MLTGIKRTPLQSEIIKFVQSYIAEKELNVGDRLPSQAELIEMMGISRTSLREALKTLEAKDILEVKNGKGIYVKDNTAQTLIDQLTFTQEKEVLLELLEARRILEREIMRLAVRNITDSELDQLEALLKVIMDKYSKSEKQNTEDKQFHYLIYQFSHNRIMHQLIQSISNLMDQFWNFPLAMESPFTETIPMHVDLYQALRDRDGKRAQEVNEQILDMIVRDVEEQV